ncbi:MAG TPA: phosphate starvation-inducible protein PhoH, partial [Flavobacteriales bacterium]|nr:phosphate starvation-inducible protein PhoH [Flavobacteriales bacterium]
MGEIELDLGRQNPVNLYGVNNENLKVIRDHFPKLKIIARGNIMKAVGNDEEIEDFRRKIAGLIEISEKRSIDSRALLDLLSGELNEGSESTENAILHGIKGNLIRAHSVNQRELADSVAENDLIIAVGPAGTGKTYTAVAMAVKYLKERKVRKIILTRPAVEAGESLGFLPGDLKEKMDPYLQPLYDALHDMIPYDKLTEYVQSGIIQIAPLAYMRGRTLDHAFVILDEAQNATESQFKMFVTRMGKSAKFIVTGDVSQIDL